MSLNKNGMENCQKCKSDETGSELRCQGSYVATKCYACGYEGPTSMSRERAKEDWNKESRKQ